MQRALLICGVGLLAMTGCSEPSESASPRGAQERNALDVAISSYLSTAGSQARDVAFDEAGNIFVVGGTQSKSFEPTVGPPHAGDWDVFVYKISAEGKLIWSRLVGGPTYERAYGVEVDAQGFVYVGGRAGPGFPTTEGVLQPTFAGDDDPNRHYGPQDAFAFKLSPDGKQLIYSTYVGAASKEFFRDIDIDDQGHLYGALTALTRPLRFVRADAYQSQLPKGSTAAVIKLTPDGRSVVWASYLGAGDAAASGGTPSIRVDRDYSVVISAATRSAKMPISEGAVQPRFGGKIDMYVARLSADGRRLLSGTYVGGSSTEYGDTHNLALDAEGNVILAATTLSSDLQLPANAFQKTYGGTGGGFNQKGDGFVVKLSRDGTRMLGGTYLGGKSGEGLEGVAVGADGMIWVSGGTYSRDFPVTQGAFQVRSSGFPDAFAALLSSDLTRLEYATLVGGSDSDLGLAAAAGPGGRYLMAGTTRSTDFPTRRSLYPAGSGELTSIFLAFDPDAPSR